MRNMGHSSRKTEASSIGCPSQNLDYTISNKIKSYASKRNIYKNKNKKQKVLIFHQTSIQFLRSIVLLNVELFAERVNNSIIIMGGEIKFNSERLEFSLGT